MRTLTLLLCAATMGLSACDQPKDRTEALARQRQQDLAERPKAAVPAGPAPLSRALPARPEFPGFYLDTIGPAFDPITKPAVIKRGDVLEMTGFGYDPVALAPAKGVDLVVDGQLFGTEYGHARQDVADFKKTPALVPVGYRTIVTKDLGPGAHEVVVRVIAADGLSYYQSPAIKFEVR